MWCAADYRDDRNGDAGWQVTVSWRPTASEPWPAATMSAHETLGVARRYGLDMACRAGVTEVEVAPADRTGEPVCRYSRTDNRWRDLRDDIARFERQRDRADMAADALRHARALDPQQTRTVLAGVLAGGVTAHAGDHAGCRLLHQRGLLGWDGRCWQLTATGAATLERDTGSGKPQGFNGRRAAGRSQTAP